MSEEPFPHGEVRGYLRHKRGTKDTPPTKACVPCRRAWNAYYRKHRS